MRCGYGRLALGRGGDYPAPGDHCSAACNLVPIPVDPVTANYVLLPAYITPTDRQPVVVLRQRRSQARPHSSGKQNARFERRPRYRYWRDYRRRSTVRPTAAAGSPAALDPARQYSMFPIVGSRVRCCGRARRRLRPPCGLWFCGRAFGGYGPAAVVWAVGTTALIRCAWYANTAVRQARRCSAAACTPSSGGGDSDLLVFYVRLTMRYTRPSFADSPVLRLG